LRSPRTISVLVLLAIATLLAGANVWFAAARSLIPLEVDGVVVRKEIRREKHPGRDDVWLIGMRGQSLMQVDQAVFDHVAVGDHLRKQRWSRSLDNNAQPFDLDWSADTRGMVWAMPLILAVMLAMVLVQRPSATRNCKLPPL
jgi:hypothetical protein